MREQTFYEAMEDVQLAWGKLMIALMQEALKPAILFLRFLFWLNG